MQKDDFIRARTNATLKAEAQEILSTLGITLTDAINLFLAQVTLQKGIPFEVRLPNNATIQAMKEIEENSDSLTTMNIEAFKASVES